MITLERRDNVQPVRSLPQNSLMWAMLHDISEQLEWIVDGQKVFMSDEDWKNVFTAGLYKESRIAQGINGGYVILGKSTRRMTKKEMVELIEFMQWFGAEKNIKFRAPSSYEQYRENSE